MADQNSQHAEKIVNITHADAIIINNKEKERIFVDKKKLRKTLLILAIILVPFAFCFFGQILPAIRWTARWNEYDAVSQEYSDLANEAFLNGDYLSAAQFYHRIAVACVDDENYVSSRCYEGLCYLKEAQKVSDISEKNSLLERSYQVFSEISSTDYADTVYYYFALSKISEIYEFKGYSYDKADWVQLVSKLDFFAEQNLEQGQVVQNHFYGQTQLYKDVMVAVYNALLSYYSNIDVNGIPSIMIKSYNEKIQEYLNALISLENGGSIDISHDAYLITRSANAIIHGAIYFNDNNEAVANIKKAIELCNSYLDTFQLTSENTYAYSVLRHFIGKGYLALYIYQKKIIGNKQDELLQKAYTTIRPLLDINTSNSDIIEEISTAAFYLITTHKCTEADINKILYFWSINLNNIEQSTLPTNRILLDYYICSSMCQYILNNYYYNEEAFELGCYAVEKLSSQSSLLSETNIPQELVDSLANYYFNHEPNIKNGSDSVIVSPELKDIIFPILESSEDNK